MSSSQRVRLHSRVAKIDWIMTKLSRAKHTKTVHIFGKTLSSKKLEAWEAFSISTITYLHTIHKETERKFVQFWSPSGREGLIMRYQERKIFKGQPIVQIFVLWNIEGKRHGIRLLTARTLDAGHQPWQCKLSRAYLKVFRSLRTHHILYLEKFSSPNNCCCGARAPR